MAVSLQAQVLALRTAVEATLTGPAQKPVDQRSRGAPDSA